MNLLRKLIASLFTVVLTGCKASNAIEFSAAHQQRSIAQTTQHIVMTMDPSYAIYLYWAPAILIFMLLVILTLLQFFSTVNQSAVLTPIYSQHMFALLTSLSLLLFRWPFFSLTEQDPDESQAIAGAITLLHDPIFWRSVDGGTHGPFAYYALVLPAALGIKIDYGSARLVGLLMLIASIWLLYASLRVLFTDRSARLAVLPLILCAGLFSGPSYIAYNAEHVTVLMISLGLYLVSRLTVAPSQFVGTLSLLTGFVLGCVPFTKLQGVPMALVLTLWGYAAIIRRTRSHYRSAMVNLSAFTIGGVIMSTLVVGVMMYCSNYEHFWQSYIRNNLAYASYGGGLAPNANLAGQFSQFVDLITYAPESAEYFTAQGLLILLGILGCGFLLAGNKFDAKNLGIVVVSMIIALTTVYSIVQPGRQFYHYVLFVFIPLTFVTGSLFASIIESIDSRNGRAITVFIFMVLAVMYPLRVEIARGYDIFSYILSQQITKRERAVAKILSYASPGDALIVWGLDPQLYVETGLHQGTRDGTTAGVMTAGAYVLNIVTTYYLDRFLADIRRAPARVFVDAVGRGAFRFDNRERFSHECVPEVDNFVSRHYIFAGDVDGVRIYVARGRLSAISETAAPFAYPRVVGISGRPTTVRAQRTAV